MTRSTVIALALLLGSAGSALADSSRVVKQTIVKLPTGDAVHKIEVGEYKGKAFRKETLTRKLPLEHGGYELRTVNGVYGVTPFVREEQDMNSVGEYGGGTKTIVRTTMSGKTTEHTITRNWMPKSQGGGRGHLVTGEVVETP